MARYFIMFLSFKEIAQSYHIAGKFGGNNVWQKWMDHDFGQKFW